MSSFRDVYIFFCRENKTCFFYSVAVSCHVRLSEGIFLTSTVLYFHSASEPGILCHMRWLDPFSIYVCVCVFGANIKNSFTHPTMPQNVLWSPCSHGVTPLSAVEPPEAINAPVTTRICFVCQIFLSVVGAFAQNLLPPSWQGKMTVLMHPPLKHKDVRKIC